jgi:hypothetical protein
MKIEFPVNEISHKKLTLDHIYLVKDCEDDYGYLFYDNENKNDYIVVFEVGLIERVALYNLYILKDVTDTLEIKS